MAVSDNAAAFLGINNENEFYSAHYLSEVFKGDISEVLSQWLAWADVDEHYQTPHHRLRNLGTEYFAMRERSQKERSKSKATAMQREFFQSLVAALDIPWHPENIRVGNDIELPVLSRVPNNDRAKLWVLGALDPEKEGMDPLLLKLSKDQFIGEGPHADSLKNTSWYDLINNVVFKQDDPPRWVLLLSDRQLVLIDRYKWLQNRLIRFDWDEILGRKDDLTLKATAVLLHRQSLVPDQGGSLLDNLDENSHKHAFGVSEDLKYALREAIEILGNEAAGQLIQRNDISFTGKSALDADKLSRECLRYMYRLLFLFYIEARPELGYVPHQSDAYRKGYSLESLRDLELVKLTTDESRSGFYLHSSINKLFKLIHEGYQGEREAELGDAWFERGIHNTFALEKLDSHLFDPKRTPYLNKVKFSNKALQRIIRLMSLTRETSGRGRKRRGRVSYAQLGINQLGAVYEALLSYRGFFAADDLYEVKKAGDSYNELDTGYFVSATEIDDYEDEEKVFVKDESGHQALKKHPKGKFIYRLAGRDRQKSASYYTPEVLTKCLVKYTLKERLEGLTADEILNLSVCEPAMGSAAFLNEAVNQLSEAYLTLKQQELKQRISHEEYREALQQVKMHIADHNVYGIDLNPIAVELAEVSLWLNALSKSNQVPWFGYQLFSGNSLIGARRQVYYPAQLLTSKKDDRWFKHEPKRLDPLSLGVLSGGVNGGGRLPEEIYHFLLPDEGMVGVNDKEAKKIRPGVFANIKQWKTQFLKPFTKDEVQLLQGISASIDALWLEHTNTLRAHRDQTEDRFNIWGQDTKKYHTSTAEKDRLRATGIFNTNAKVASSYRRLKLVMDYWCALWFWPLDKVALLPDRSSWLFELNLILRGQVYSFQPEQAGLFGGDDVPKADGFAKPDADMFADEKPQLNFTGQEKAAQYVKTASGELHLEKLFDQFPRLKLVNELGEKFRFFHWELTFADLFSDEGGFDLMLGNPPWIKMEWNEGSVLGDYNPLFVLRKFSATKLRGERADSFEHTPQLEQSWFSEMEEAEGMQNFLNAYQNYPELKGIQTNLYKCFLPQAWRYGKSAGVSGFLHPEGVFDDPKGGRFRSLIYERLTTHYQFTNVRLLFAEVMIWVKYSINIYRSRPGLIGFDSVSNLFDPVTVERCYQNKQDQRILGQKNSGGHWETDGNFNRVICCNRQTLKIFADLFNEVGARPEEARLPSIHTVELVSVLDKLSKFPKRLCDLGSNYYSTAMFDETYAQRDKTIKRITMFPSSLHNWVVSGPHFFVATAFYKTPRAICNTPRAYDPLCLAALPQSYLPRTNYLPLPDFNEYQRRVPNVSWVDEGHKTPRKVTEYYRLFHRAMLNQSGERTLISAIFPKNVAHMNAVRSYCFGDTHNLVKHSAFCFSLVADFLCKSTGKANLHQMLDELVFPELNQFEAPLFSRVLGLSCIAESYRDLWQAAWSEGYEGDAWTANSGPINQIYFSKLDKNWRPSFGLYSDFDRRQAILEIDVLMSMVLGLTLNELLTIYRVQFTVLQQNERETFYDKNGNIVFTVNIGLAGVGMPRKASKRDEPATLVFPDGTTEMEQLGWEDIMPNSNGHKNVPDGTNIHIAVIDDTLPGGPREKVITYVAPFYLPNREEDYRVAWEVFTERFKDKKNRAYK